MSAPPKPRLLGLHLDRVRGQASTAKLVVSRNLASGKLDEIPLSRTELLKIIRDAAQALDTLGVGP